MLRNERRFGIEFELTGLNGDTPRLPDGMREYFAWHGDSSITALRAEGTREEVCIHCGNAHMSESNNWLGTGELVVSPPQEMGFYLQDSALPRVLSWLTENNSQLSCKGEHKCSAHIHVSVDSTELRAIAEYGLEHEDKAFEIWSPEASRVRYCHKFEGDTASEILDDNDRYCWLNINPAYRKHNTVEFRLFNGTVDIGEVRRRIRWCLVFVERAVTAYKVKKAREQAIASARVIRKPVARKTAIRSAVIDASTHDDMSTYTSAFEPRPAPLSRHNPSRTARFSPILVDYTHEDIRPLEEVVESMGARIREVSASENATGRR